MDFSFSEEQEAVRELAGRIFTDLATHERLREFESEPDGDRFDRKLWAELAAAGLLGIALPEEVGGAGLGFVETGLVVEAAGQQRGLRARHRDAGRGRPGRGPVRHRGPAPAVAARRGGGRDRADHGPGGAGRHPGSPSVVAERDGDGWMLSGTKSCVPSGMIAEAVLVTARVEPDAVAVFIVDTSAAGVSRERQVTNTGQPEAVLTLAGDARSAPTRCWDRWRTAPPSSSGWSSAPPRPWPLAQAGAAAAALALVAEYTKTREQFGKPIATFQAVGQRAADAYVDTEAIRLTAWQAAWRIDEGLPADKEVAIAKFWAADGGQRVVHAAVHLHGGVGVDRDYPLHRYFLDDQAHRADPGGRHRAAAPPRGHPGRRARLTTGAGLSAPA